MSPLVLDAAALAAAPLPTDAAAMIDELRALEELKCAAEARQARITAELDRLRGEDAATHAEVALARRISPHRSRQVLSLARFLDTDLPHTRKAFDAGRISEWRAMLIARETSCLQAEHRAEVDRVVAEDAEALSAMGDRQLVAECRQHAARLDAAAVAARRRRAESERRVSIRPAPDAMVYLTALLPVATGVGVYAALRAHAETAVGNGQATGIGQAMADELVRRTTAVGPDLPQPVSLRLTMSAGALFDSADDPAFLDRYGPIPAEAARALVADNLEASATVWLKRLFVRPDAGELITMDSRARRFPAALAEFIELRDRWCRTPWCGAPIRHRDHVVAHADGGPTDAANGQGLCVACNQAKQATGWQARPGPGPRHSVVVTTPTGHRYHSRAPAA